jgi:hypothetical protein
MLERICAGFAARLAGRDEEARASLQRALEDADALGAVEVACRLRGQLARLEPEGSPARARRIGDAAGAIRRQADAIANADLRACYLARRERAAILRESDATATG